MMLSLYIENFNVTVYSIVSIANNSFCNDMQHQFINNLKQHS